MKHYGVGEWTDLVRDLVSREQRSEMEEHRANCSKCEAMFEFLRRVAITAQNESFYEAATEALLPAARRAFALQKAAGTTRDRLFRVLQTLVAQLTYDSAADLQPAGARGPRPTSRQMLYEAGDYCLDLRFDREPDSLGIALVGQIANRKKPGSNLATLPVFIVSNNEIVAEAASNQFGEFSLDYTPRAGLLLRVALADAGIQLEVPLKRVLEQHEK